MTGKGADIAIVDDPHSEQEAKQAETGPEIFDGVYEWYTSGIRHACSRAGRSSSWSRAGRSATSWGRCSRQMEADIKAGVPEGQYDKWEVLNLPAILDEGLPTERSMWPAFWPAGIAAHAQRAPRCQVAEPISTEPDVG